QLRRRRAAPLAVGGEGAAAARLGSSDIAAGGNRADGRVAARAAIGAGLAVSQAVDLQRFYDDAYSSASREGDRFARWRALGAVGKADHVEELCARLGLGPQAVLEVGCGDGALLAELSKRSFAPRLAGVEISSEAATTARSRGLDVQVFDGSRLPAADSSYDLGVLSHV